VINSGPIALEGTRLQVASSAAVNFTSSVAVTVPHLEPFEGIRVRIPFRMAVGLKGVQAVSWRIEAVNATAVNQSAMTTLVRRVNYDNLPRTSAADDVESDATAWKTAATQPDGRTWRRQQGGDLNTVWLGEDLPALSDQRLESPRLEVGSRGLAVRYDYRYKFETSTDPVTERTSYFDGAVIEFSLDDGKTWKDVSALGIDPGYRGRKLSADNPLTPLQGNPPADPPILRPALADQNPKWPGWNRGELLFGAKVADRGVRLRFRVGTDQAVGSHGLELDNVVFDGITNHPFATIGANHGVCKADERLPANPVSLRGAAGGGCDTTTHDGSPVGFFLLAGAGAWALRRRRRPVPA
jgi:uncharacterized protein (TIGR03382 family)